MESKTRSKEEIIHSHPIVSNGSGTDLFISIESARQCMEEYAELRLKQAQQADKSQFIKDYKQYKENLKYLGGAGEWTQEKINQMNKVEVFEAIKGFNELITFFDSVLYAYEEGAKDWEERALKAEAQQAVWVRGVLPEIIDGKSKPKYVKVERKRHDGTVYISKAVAYYFPDKFKSIEFEDWDDYSEEKFPYTESDEQRGVVWLCPGWYEDIECETCDTSYWSAPLNVIEWLDENNTSNYSALKEHADDLKKLLDEAQALLSKEVNENWKLKEKAAKMEAALTEAKKTLEWMWRHLKSPDGQEFLQVDAFNVPANTLACIDQALEWEKEEGNG
jgi:hypothetical protein